MTTCIEVGANQGTDTDRFIEQYDRVFSFEPIQELCSQLWEKYRFNSKVMIFPFAVDIVNAFKNFNISTGYDWGSSSLFEFDYDNLRGGKWYEPDPNFYRGDMETHHSYLVPTITLYDFVTMYNINKIDYLHIDAQGNDINVLKSLGNKLNIVQAGILEVGCGLDIYKNTDNRIETAITFLNSNGFRITDSFIQTEGHEINLYFERK
jgi:FkbM family methyltransferase